MKMAQYAGQVFYNNEAAGTGILVREGGPDVPYERRGKVRNKGNRLKEGDWVEFDVVQGTDGPRACNVRLLEGTRRSSMEIVLFPSDVLSLSADLTAIQRPSKNQLTLTRANERETLAQLHRPISAAPPPSRLHGHCHETIAMAAEMMRGGMSRSSQAPCAEQQLNRHRARS